MKTTLLRIVLAMIALSPLALRAQDYYGNYAPAPYDSTGVYNAANPYNPYSDNTYNPYVYPPVIQAAVVYTAPVMYSAPVVYNAPVIYNAPVYYGAPPVETYCPAPAPVQPSTVLVIGAHGGTYGYARYPAPYEGSQSTVTTFGRTGGWFGR